jgi:hypothetical protein
VGALLLAALLVLLVAAALLWWTVRSETGTAWLLARLPGAEVTGGRGTLWGDFSAQRLNLALPGGVQVIVHDLAWRGLRVEHAPGLVYQARVSIDALDAGTGHARHGQACAEAAAAAGAGRRGPAARRRTAAGRTRRASAARPASAGASG